MPYRTILIVITLLSFVIPGLSEIRFSLIVALALINLCVWTLPWVEKWRKQRNALSDEGERHLLAGNYPEAEQSLTLALAEAEHQKTLISRRFSILRNLAEAQRKL